MIMGKALWEQSAPVPLQKEDEPQLAEAVAECTRELLATLGWCLWKCSVLDGEVICVVQDELVEGVPEGYQVYTEAEIEELCQDDISNATIRLVHEVKKLVGAKIVSGDEEGK